MHLPLHLHLLHHFMAINLYLHISFTTAGEAPTFYEPSYQVIKIKIIIIPQIELIFSFSIGFFYGLIRATGD